jgi:hypothetical protein
VAHYEERHLDLLDRSLRSDRIISRTAGNDHERRHHQSLKVVADPLPHGHRTGDLGVRHEAMPRKLLAPRKCARRELMSFRSAAAWRLGENTF